MVALRDPRAIQPDIPSGYHLQTADRRERAAQVRTCEPQAPPPPVQRCRGCLAEKGDSQMDAPRNRRDVRPNVRAGHRPCTTAEDERSTKAGERQPQTPRLFSDAELAWLRREHGERSLPETVELFNRTFGRDVDCRQLRDANYRYAFGRSYPKRSHNLLPVQTSEKPLWSERRRSKGTATRERWIILVKVPGPSPHKHNQARGLDRRTLWMPGTRWVWGRPMGQFLRVTSQLSSMMIPRTVTSTTWSVCPGGDSSKVGR